MSIEPTRRSLPGAATIAAAAAPLAPAVTTPARVAAAMTTGPA